MTARALGLALLLGLAGCGYTLANAAPDGVGPFTVVAAAARTPDAAINAAAIEGAQRELAARGLLAAHGEGTTLTIAIARVEERGEGIASGSTASATPIARGLRLTIAGRATASARDSGEIAVTEVIATPGSAALAVVDRDTAAQRAGRRLGERLVRRFLGEIDPGEP